MSLDRIFKTLVSLNLSRSDAEVYIHIATTGPVTARNIITDLAFNKRQVYRSLKALKEKGIAFGNKEYPEEFSAVSLEKALDLLLEVKKEQTKSLQSIKASLTSELRIEKKKSQDSN